LNKRDIEPLLINTENEYIRKNEIPGIRIYRSEGKRDPFDIYFCKTKYNAYEILMGLSRQAVEDSMAQRSKKDLAFLHGLESSEGEPVNSVIDN